MDLDARKAWVVGTDIGGTFTDIIGVNLVTGEQRLGKVPSTPPTYFDGVINGLERAGIKGEEVLSFRHGAIVSVGKKIRVAWVPTVEEVQPHITISRPPGW